MKYCLDSHTHTLVSGHAYNTIQEMVHAASLKGLKLLAITEHAKSMPGSCTDLYFMNLKILPRKQEGMEVLFGVELNIMDYQGRVDMEDWLLRRMDVAIASLHTPCLEPGSVSENTQALLGVIENPLIHIIGHPDDGRYPVDYDTIVAAAKEHHVLLELNNHSLDPSGGRVNTRENDTIMLELCRKYKAPIIMNSDAHWCGAIGDCQFTMPLIEELAFPEELIVNTSVDYYKSFLTKG